MKTRYTHLPAINTESLLALSARVIERLYQHSGFAYASPLFAASVTELSCCHTAFADDHPETSDSYTRFADDDTELSYSHTELWDSYTGLWDSDTKNADSHTVFLYTNTEFADGSTKALYVHVINLYNYLKLVVLYTDSSPPALRCVLKQNQFIIS